MPLVTVIGLFVLTLGTLDVIDELRRLAPTFVVRGNVDKAHWAQGLPATADVEVGGLMFHVLHDIAELDLDPAAVGYAAVVYGHSHQPLIDTRAGVLFLNPGSAGPRRFRLPVSIARVSGAHRSAGAKPTRQDS